MRLLCALISVLFLTISPTSAQPLNYDPYFVLPAGLGQTSIDAGVVVSDTGDILNTSDVVAMAKFNPHEKVEAGARFAFGWLNDTESNFSSLVVGAKYSLGHHSAATFNLTVPAGGVDHPGLSLGLMNSTELTTGLMLNAQFQLGLLKGYNGGKGIVVDALIEPVKVFNNRYSAYLDLFITSNTDRLSDFLAVNLGPNIDISIGDGSVLNIGVTLGLSGDAKQQGTGLTFILLRNM